MRRALRLREFALSAFATVGHAVVAATFCAATHHVLTGDGGIDIMTVWAGARCWDVAIAMRMGCVDGGGQLSS